MTTDTATQPSHGIPRINDTAPNFTAETTQGPINFHEWVGRRMGDLVLASQGLHSCVHHGTWLHGAPSARVYQAQHEDHRP